MKNLLIGIVIVLLTQLIFTSCDNSREACDIIIADSGIFTDPRDGQSYKWVKIGSQIWMAENLNFKTEKGSWCFNDTIIKCNEYGRLYNWATAIDACPPGWRLPSNDDWKELRACVGRNPGRILKAKAENPLHGGIMNNYSFNALSGGNRTRHGSFSGIDVYSNFWTASDYSERNAWYRYFYKHHNRMHYFLANKHSGLSIRCIRIAE